MKKINLFKVFGILTVTGLSFGANIVGVKAVNPDEVNSNVPSGTYDTVQKVTLTCTTGKPIYYTNNGTTPSSSSTQYTAPITIAYSQTIKAGCAFGLGSSMSEFKYGINALPGEVKSNVPSGTYTTVKSVQLSCTSGDAIYYTTNGSTPTQSSTKYTGPITVSTSQTIRAGCSFGLGSSVIDLNYVINIAAATPKPTATKVAVVATKVPVATSTPIPTIAPTATPIPEPTYVSTNIPKVFISVNSQTTDLTKVTSEEQLKTVENFILDIPEYNMIQFTENVDLSGTGAIENLDFAVSLDTKGKVSIDDTKLAALNKPAKVTMRGLSFSDTPKVLRNGEDAKDYVSNIAYDKQIGLLTFDVKGFSTYEAVEAPKLEPVVAKKKNNTVMTIFGILSGVIFTSGLAAAYYLWNKKKTKKSTETTVPAVPTI